LKNELFTPNSYYFLLTFYLNLLFLFSKKALFALFFLIGELKKMRLAKSDGEQVDALPFFQFRHKKASAGSITFLSGLKIVL